MYKSWDKRSTNRPHSVHACVYVCTCGPEYNYNSKINGIHDCMVAILGALMLLGNYWMCY